MEKQDAMETNSSTSNQGGRGRKREREPVKNFLEKVTFKRGLNAGKTD